MKPTEHIPRAIEVGFPIAEINRLAVPERNSFIPIYQMHKWFARRASCVFRAILLGSLKPAFKPDGEAVWQWRGALPEEVTCPACRHPYDPFKGNVPAKGKFLCQCGNVDKIIESIRRLPRDRRLPVRPYAIQAYIPTDNGKNRNGVRAQSSFINDAGMTSERNANHRMMPETLSLPKNGKFFKGFSSSDQARRQRAESLWEKHKDTLPYPYSKIPVGYNTNQMLKHHYNYWHETFFPRQLL